MPAIQCLGKHMFKATLSYLVSLKTAKATQDTVIKTKQE